MERHVPLGELQVSHAYGELEELQGGVDDVSVRGLHTALALLGGQRPENTPAAAIDCRGGFGGGTGVGGPRGRVYEQGHHRCCDIK